jgi:hypothetical protein
MDAIPAREITSLPADWLPWYAARGIDLAAIVDDGFHWWTRDLLAWMQQYGAERFAYEAIWDFDWAGEASRQGFPVPEHFLDPRNPLQRLLHKWLAESQPLCSRWMGRKLDGLLRRLTPIPP